MRSMNRRKVRVALSQLFRCCFKTLARETSWAIFGCCLQNLEEVPRPALTSAGTRREDLAPAAVDALGYGVAVMVNRDAGTLVFKS